MEEVQTRIPFLVSIASILKMWLKDTKLAFRCSQKYAKHLPFNYKYPISQSLLTFQFLTPSLFSTLVFQVHIIYLLSSENKKET